VLQAISWMGILMSYDADIKAAEYGVRWRLQHPGYHIKKSKEWRIRNPDYNRDYRVRNPAYRLLENWRNKCKRAGLEPPAEAYRRNRP
jgi:hypothetical protein